METVKFKRGRLDSKFKSHDGAPEISISEPFPPSQPTTVGCKVFQPGQQSLQITYQQDCLVLLSIFPEEVWQIVLSGISHPREYLHTIGASPFFRKVICQNGTQILFEDVTKIMFKLYLNTEHGENVAGWSKADLLPLRQVCKSWMTGVGTILQNLDIHFMFHGDYSQIPNTSFVYEFDNGNQYSTQLDSSDQIYRLLEHFKESHSSSKRNPFVTRYIDIDVDNMDEVDDDLSTSLEELISLLEIYGSHVWYCKINFGLLFRQQQLKCYKKLLLILQLVPNLKVLSFKSIQNLETHKLQKYTDKNPLPKLEQLQHLFIKNLKPNVFTSLLKQNPQISNLEVESWSNVDKIKCCLEELPKLSSFADNVEGKAMFQAFSTAKVQCSLTKLNISFEVNIPWNSIFRLIERKFGESLKELKITLPSNNGNDLKALNLLSLKRLEMEFDKPSPLDFLLPMINNLEELAVTVDGNIKSFQAAMENEQILKFYTFRNDLNRSNIWTLFPLLKSIVYESLGSGSKKTYSQRNCNM